MGRTRNRMNLIEQLRRDEGVRHVPYQDSRGFWTCGVGRKLTSDYLGPDGNPLSMDPVSDEQVNQWLQADILTVQNGLAPYHWYQIQDEVRRGACENMAFNLGVHGLLHFPHFIAALDMRDWETAAEEMADSEWAKQVGDRAKRLEQQILAGIWV